MSLSSRTLFITGASRGIGLAIAKRAARDGARIAIVAKTAEPDPRLPGTVFTAAEEIREAGGEALPLVCDIRHEDQVEAAVASTVETFGGIDICINNASAISLTDTSSTPMKRYDLMHQINARGTFLTSKTCLPWLKQSPWPHILNISPPLDMRPKWFGPHVAYTMAKYGMSLCALGMAEEFRQLGIGVNTLWPITSIDTSAVRNILGGDSMAERSRLPSIMADAAYAVLTRDPRTCTGNFFIDEEVLRADGVADFSPYAAPGVSQFYGDFFVPDEVFDRSPTDILRGY